MEGSGLPQCIHPLTGASLRKVFGKHFVGKNASSKLRGKGGESVRGGGAINLLIGVIVVVVLIIILMRLL